MSWLLNTLVDKELELAGEVSRLFWFKRESPEYYSTVGQLQATRDISEMIRGCLDV